MVEVTVINNNIDKASRALRKRMQREGIFRDAKNRRNYEKPSQKRVRKQAESLRRVRKLQRKKDLES